MNKGKENKGMLITFEGPEGSGKSTHVKLLCRYLRQKGLPVVYFREPGGTLISEKIRRILLDPQNKKMNAVCEMLLYQAARAQLMSEKVLSALGEKRIVILDRFLDATLAYQGYGAGINLKIIKQIGGLVTSGIKPDLTILLDIAAEKGLRKVGRRDRIERKPLKFHQRVRKGYLKLAHHQPRRIKVVPLVGGISRTQDKIRKIVEAKLKDGI